MTTHDLNQSHKVVMFEALGENAVDAVCVATLHDHKLIYVNPAYCDLHGYTSSDQVLGSVDDAFTIYDGCGKVKRRVKCKDEPGRRMFAAVEDFALSILNPDEHKGISGGRENLRNMAVMESAYLSSRTGFPEEPAKVLDMVSR